MPDLHQVRFTSVLLAKSAVQRHPAGDPAALHKVVHAVEGLEQGGLPQPDGPMNATTSCSGMARLTDLSA